MEELNLYAHNSSMYSMTPHNNQIMCFYRTFLINLQISTSSTQSLPWSSLPLGWRNKTDSYGQTRPAGGRWPDWWGRGGGSGGGGDGVPVVAGPAPDARHGQQLAAPPLLREVLSPAALHLAHTGKCLCWGCADGGEGAGAGPGQGEEGRGPRAPGREERLPRGGGVGNKGPGKRGVAGLPSPSAARGWAQWAECGPQWVGTQAAPGVGAAQHGAGSSTSGGWRQHPNRRGRGCAHKRLHKCVNKTRIEAQCDTFNKT